jgi:hypothetical protein
VAVEKGDAAAAEVMMKIYELYIFGARACDHPFCMDPVFTAFLSSFNDRRSPTYQSTFTFTNRTRTLNALSFVVQVYIIELLVLFGPLKRLPFFKCKFE